MDRRKYWLLGLAFLLGLVITFYFFAQSYKKSEEEPPATSREPDLRIAGDNNFPPYEFLDEKGEYRGFNIDIIRAIEKAMDIEIEIIPMRWTDAITALEMGNIDAIQGMTEIPAREEVFRFTQPSSIRSTAIFVRGDTDYIRDIKDLNGARVSYQKGDVNEARILDIPYTIPIARNNQVEALEALLKNEADAFIGNRIATVYQLHKMKASNKVKVLEEPFAERRYGPVTGYENIRAYGILDRGLSIIKDSGEYDIIYRRWFGDQLSPSVINFRYYLKEIIIGIAVMVIILGSFFLWNKSLQLQVAKRTRELEEANINLQDQQEEIYKLAYYDSNTGLPNRLYFIDKLEKTIKELGKGEILGVFYLDLDKFRHINDTLGHDLGDRILILIAERLEAMEPINLVAKGTGDGFMILNKNIRDREGALEFARAIIVDFRQPISVEDHKLYLTTSVGIGLYPEAGNNSSDLIKNAELALYRAKDMGGNSYFEYNKEIGRREYINLTKLNELREAVTNNEFVLYYQPKIDIKTREIIGVEALIRWEKPGKGLVFPDEFIALAEDTGLIFPIGEWVIREACRQNKEWMDKGYKPIRACVNISARQFQGHNFLETVRGALEETELEAKYLGLEITESVAVFDIENTINLLKDLKKLGVFVVMDDFGTGYSSLSYLKEMDIDEIKIDRSFITDIETNENNRSISNTIILLAKQFNILVTAEGVEKAEQLSILQDMKCDKAQGYYFSKPIPSKEFEKLLLARRI